MHALLFGLAAFGVTTVLFLVVLRLFPFLGLLDFPERYGLVRQRIPYPTGGVGIIVFLSFLLWQEPWTLHNVGIVAAATILGTICFIDDRRPLPALVRLAVQALAAVAIFVSGSRIYSFTNPLPLLTGSAILSLDTLNITVPFWHIGPLPVLSGIFTVLWLGLTINALNWFDGIPGQVSVIATIGFLTIGLLSISSRVNQPDVAILSFVLAGIAGSCILFDLPPPKMLMGDTGAMFFGLMIGVLTIYAGGKVATAFLVLGVPLLDFALVFTRRILQGRSPLKGSMQGDHLHHRLLKRGWHPGQIIVLTAGIGGVFGISALFLGTLGKFIAATLLFFVVTGISAYAGVSSPRTSSDR